MRKSHSTVVVSGDICGDLQAAPACLQCIEAKDRSREPSFPVRLVALGCTMSIILYRHNITRLKGTDSKVNLDIFRGHEVCITRRSYLPARNKIACPSAYLDMHVTRCVLTK